MFGLSPTWRSRHFIHLTGITPHHLRTIGSCRQLWCAPTKSRKGARPSSAAGRAERLRWSAEVVSLNRGVRNFGQVDGGLRPLRQPPLSCCSESTSHRRPTPPLMPVSGVIPANLHSFRPSEIRSGSQHTYNQRLPVTRPNCPKIANTWERSVPFVDFAALCATTAFRRFVQ